MPINDSNAFLSPDWGLRTKVARQLYHQVVEPSRREKGIVDAHTHLSVRQIVENDPFPNILAAMVVDTDPRWPGCDHYITQLVAKRGAPGSLIHDRDAKPYAQWQAIAEVFPDLVGNHVYTWAHMELKVLGIEDTLISSATAERIWVEAKERLQQENLKPQGLLRQANAKVISTTHDPLDDLKYLERAREEVEGIRFSPTFRPDKAMDIFADEWRQYVTRLCELTAQPPTLDGLLNALRERHEHFQEHGCRASDHSLVVPYGAEVSAKKAGDIFDRVYNQADVQIPAGSNDAREFLSFMMHRLFEMNREKGWVTQIRFKAVKNMNSYLRKFGSAKGGDVLRQDINIVDNLVPLLDRFCSGEEPAKDLKVVLYALDPTHYPTVATLTRAFPSTRWGLARWFNDTTGGIESQLAYMAETETLADCAGMVCDGRKILSFGPRHEVFARAACNVVGGLVEKGMIPARLAEDVMEGLCYRNQVKLFGFDV